MVRRWGWLADLISRIANAPFRKRSKFEKALLRRMLRERDAAKKKARDASHWKKV